MLLLNRHRKAVRQTGSGSPFGKMDNKLGNLVRRNLDKQKIF